MTRYALRKDDCEKPIVDALRAAGVAVEVVGRPLDLSVAVRGADGKWRTFYIECKDDDGRFTQAQIEFMARWPGEIHVCRSPEQAIRAALGAEAMR